MKKQIKVKTAKIVPLLFLTTSGLIACGGNGGGKPSGDIDIWSVSSAEKIYQDQPSSVYNDIRGDAKVNILAFKGENEGKHLIITPTCDIKTFDATVTDLKSASGDTISKDLITIFVEKYMNMTKIYDSVSTAPTGYVPDGMVPIENSLKFNDNKIKANQNQGLYFNVDVPVNQKEGIYTGEITLNLDGLVKTIPMQVEILDVTVNEETHSRAVFLDHWQFWNGELDSSRSMYEKYHHALGDYRLSPSYAVIENEFDNTSSGIKYYVERSYEIMQDKRITSIGIPYVQATVNNQISFDENVFKNYIREFYNKSCETNFNMLKRLSYYLGMIDEPYEFNLMDRAIFVNQRYRQVIVQIANELNSVKADHPMHEELIQSIRNIPHIITTAWHEECDGLIDTYCPKANFYDTPELRAHYYNQKEKWWYTCVEPHVPYPTYHTEDILSSARLMGWMQANYDIVGNLFWAANVYGRQNGDSYAPIEEYYSGNPARYYGCNGDGYLFYPGAQYGYDGPLPSLRIQAIRDGNEEYEVLYNLKQKAKSLGLSDKGIFPLLTNSLYNGTKIIGNSALVEQARRTMADLTLASNNGSDFVVSKCNMDKTESIVKFEFYAKDGATIQVNGTSLSPSRTYKQGHLYSFQDNISKDSNDYEIVVSYQGNSNTVKAHLCGKVSSYGPNELKDSFAKYNCSVTTSIESVEGQDMLRLDVSKGKDAKQSIKFNAPFLSQLNSNTQDITLNVYNPTSNKMLFSVGGRNADNKYDNYYHENYELQPGMNTINIPTIYMKLKDTSKISYFFLVLGNTSSKNEEAKTIYIKNVSVMNK